MTKQEEGMFKIPKQEFTAEFKELAVKRVKSGQSVGMVARELGLVEQTLRNWVKAADRGQLNPPGAKIITPEQMELSHLRAENAKLRMECEILKKRRRTSRKMHCEVRLDRRAAADLPAAGPVRDTGREPQ
jgi:transposase